MSLLRKMLLHVGMVAFSLVAFVQSGTSQPLARNSSKFLGCAYSGSQALNFENYWNQVTPENAGKWGSVEGTRDVYNWSQLDQAYNLAKTNGFSFRFHILIWGNQQPQWIRNLPPAEQLEEIIEWMDAVAERYPDIEYLEVVNEPISDPPSASHAGNQGTTDFGGYIDALGGAGDTGWDWIRTSFRLAKERFPNAQLMINEYSIVNSPNRAQRYIEIIEILQEEDLIDIIGVQAHAFSTTAQASTMTNILNQLAATGLPIQATELDIDGVDDAVQLASYQRIFPVFWDHPAVMGVTLWGWRPGLWRNNEGAYLINQQGEERPALKWLREYLGSIPIASISVRSNDGTYSITTPGGTLQMIADISPEDASNNSVVWWVSNDARATISEDGLLTALSNGDVVVTATAGDNSGISGFVSVSIANQPEVLSVHKPGIFQMFPNPVADGRVGVQTESPIQLVEIYDLSGQVLLSVKGNKSNQQLLELNLKSGMYLLTVVEEVHTTSQRLLVK